MSEIFDFLSKLLIIYFSNIQVNRIFTIYFLFHLSLTFRFGENIFVKIKWFRIYFLLKIMHLINLENINISYLKQIIDLANSYDNDNKLMNKYCGIRQKYNKAKGFILANVFFEPSTRTSLSFEVAMKKLGGDVIYFQKDLSSIKKGESVYDTLKTIETYSDIIVLRHPDQKVFDEIQTKINVPLINAGNGAGDHPSQALLDLYTINTHFDIFNYNKYSQNIKVLFVGDILHSRTIHSLDFLLSKFNCFSIYYFPYFDCKSEKVNDDNCINSFENIFEFDIIYCTRIQKERFEKNNIDISSYILTQEYVNKMKENAIIMHPLPRNEEIPVSIDENHRCVYFEQMNNGIYIRMAIIASLLLDIPDQSIRI